MTTETKVASNRWIFFGIIASIGFGLWGFLDKFSASDGLFFSNLIFFAAALLISGIFALKYPSKPSKYGLVAGICSGFINILVLTSLLSNKLILVFPFVSFGTIWFFLVYIFYLKPTYSRKTKLILSSGMGISILGLALISIGISGGISGVIAHYSFDLFAISIGIAISVFTGLWTFFTFLTISKSNSHPFASAFWIYIGGFAVALFAFFIDNNSFKIKFGFTDILIPVISGFCVFVAQIATSYGFRSTLSSGGFKQLIIAFLANGELIPIMFLSYFFLNEFSYEGVIGGFLVFVGLLITNRARIKTSK